MQHDESALVREAMRHASERLARGEKLLPAAYMLVRRNPQTGAVLTYPTAIGMAIEKPFESQAEYFEFLKTLRAEAKRLEAIAVAIGGEAEAEIEAARGPSRKRVFYLRIEDGEGIHHLHAPIENVKLGTLYDAGDVPDDLPEPLLAATTPAPTVH
ncbi:MAG TPA: hypothetical protein VFG30_16145 [Polyangiales bacterium]|jgi:hypothetical protein|nr:hypothetical protein [Polyangiales bacterium]